MKRFLATLTLGFLIVTTARAQQDSSLITLFGYPVKGYIGTALQASSLNSQTVGYLEINGGIYINESWTIGAAAAGLYYDKKLSALVTDGTYHIYAAYAGILLERNLYRSQDWNASIALLAGAGTIYYQYDRDFRKDKLWKDEIIDQTTFSVLRPSLSVTYRVGGKLWLGVTGSYLYTSPVEMIGISDDAFRSFQGGLSLRYGIF
jgi:hypothetical protein